MNIIRYIVLSCQRNHTYEHIILVNMIGQSKINAFFTRQFSGSGDHLKTTGTVSDDTSERTQPVKRKRDENISEVLLLY